ncbi:hypothetical protein IFR05_009826 [Cadophora sp. M221]|nr:hypothetical protein IFR05_009826 [Cadophora sp. M221]
MNYFRHNNGASNAVNEATQFELADDNCHIKSDPESGVLFDMESVWCSFCQKPRFEDGVCTEICICVSFVTSNDAWLPQVVDGSSFENVQTRHYNAVDTWLHGSATDENTSQTPPTSAFDAMIGISPVAASLGIFALSAENPSSPSTTSTRGLTGGTSATSTRSTTPSCERSSLDMDSSDSSEFRRLLNAKQRRREQNRNSQHRFRERKNQVTKDLQDQVDSLTKINEILNREISALRKKLGAGEGEMA